MPRLPDRFDLWVRQARNHPDVERQADLVLGALISLRTWFFLNVGSTENPQPAEGEMEDGVYLLLFSEAQRIEELVESGAGAPSPIIAIPETGAVEWVLARVSTGCRGVLVNPGEEAFAVSMERLRIFHEDWRQRGGGLSSGFWIPGMTSEEEDFWQENGL